MVELDKKPFSLSKEERDWVIKTIEVMSDEEKAAQLFVVLGDSFTEKKLTEIVVNGVGGVLLRPNDKDKVASELKRLDGISPLPLIKAANLEDGASGASSSLPRLGSEMLIAATNKKRNAYLLGKESALEAGELGLNTTFSPDADIDFNFLNPITSERTFGSSPRKVASYVKEEVKGFIDGGVYPVIKHFPGDGVDFRDQHLEPTYNTLSYSKWMETYGKVYASGIEGGALGIMVGHIVAPKVEKHLNPKAKIDEMLPASINKTLLQGIIRKKLAFNGLIYSDATIMGGFSEGMPREQAIPTMVEAGIDLIVFNMDFDEDKSYLLQGLENGLLSKERLNEAATRILAYKALLKRQRKPKEKMDCMAEKFASEGITLVKNKDNLIPISKRRFPSIKIISLGNDSCPEGSIKKIAADFLKKQGFQVEFFDINKEDIKGSSKYPPTTLNLYLANYETASNQVTVRINWQKKHALDKPAFPHECRYLFISFANPYHLIDAPRVNGYINAYCANKATVEAVLRKALGQEPFFGKSPIDPFCSLFDTRL